MTGIDDEMLGAYLDDELDAPDRARVEAALAGDPGLRERLELLRRNDDLLRAAFDDVASGPVPQRLRTATRPSAPPPPPWRRMAAPTLAAAAALLLGLGLGRVLFSAEAVPEPLATGAIPAGTPLAAALEGTPSGEVAGAGTLRVAPLATFRADDGRYCREYQARRTDGEVTVGVACREQEGWRNIAVASDRALAGYRQASAEDGLRALVGAGDAETLSATAERQALRSGWQSAAE